MSRYCPISDNKITYLPCLECDDKWCESFFCLVVGSRTFSDYDLMCKKLDHLLQSKADVVIVSGGAKGADSLAERYAANRKYPCRIFKAAWDKNGKNAGFIRNREMHEYIAKQKKRGVVAFWNGKSKGTANNFRLARKYDNPIKIIKI